MKVLTTLFSVIIVSGAFGNKFKQIAQSYYKNVHIYDVTWEEAVNVNEFINYLKQLKVKISAMFTQFCKTQTGVLHPINALGHALKEYDNAIYFVVDGVSCIGAVEVDLTKYKIDVLVSGSQKPLSYRLVQRLSHTVIEQKNALSKYTH